MAMFYELTDGNVKRPDKKEGVIWEASVGPR